MKVLATTMSDKTGAKAYLLESGIGYFENPLTVLRQFRVFWPYIVSSIAIGLLIAKLINLGSVLRAKDADAKALAYSQMAPNAHLNTNYNLG